METNPIEDAGNVIQANFTAKAPDEQQDIIDAIRGIMAAGEEVNVFELATSVDLTADMKRVRDFLVNGQICTKAEWKAALRVSAIKRELGYVPKTAVELVDTWVRRENITVDYQKRMRAQRLPVYEGVQITADHRSDTAIDSVARIQENREINPETLKRDLRLLVSRLGMKFTMQEIDDAVSAWFEKATELRVTDVMLGVAFDGAAKSQVKRDTWAAVVSQFDANEHDAAFVEAILSKFIWQVKRKILGLQVTNHLMPVLLGPQGVGKSTFVNEYLLKPVAELVGNTDFKMIEETRNTEQWRNYVLFLDEMGYAGKADIDNVKNKITAPTVTGRPMRSNENVQYRQNATFIGCSNKELDQLIRDETGNRRFAALRFASKPDWAQMQGIDTRLLWRSVDERGADPSLAVMDQLRERQEAAREKSPVEQWLDDHQVPTSLHSKRQDGRELYKDYKEWADTYTPGRVMDQSPWGKEFTRLIKAGQISGWTKPSPSNGKVWYVFGLGTARARP